jgi:ribosomal-protein-alanine N-acetyltransferase
MYTPPATPPVLTTERLILRLGEPADIPAIVRFFVDNREYLKPFWEPGPPEFYQPEGWKNRLSDDWGNFLKDKRLRLFMFPKEDAGRVIGSIEYNGIWRDPVQHCHLGYYMAENAQGKGYMSEALLAANRYVFATMNLHRIMAQYMPRNQHSGSLLKRLGFAVEGYARDLLLHGGRWEDHILTSLTNPDWKEM